MRPPMLAGPTQRHAKSLLQSPDGTLTATLTLVSTSNAATTTVKLHTDANTTRFLSDSASGVTTMALSSSSNLQKWLRTRFAKNLRYDNLVGGLLLTSGGDELGPALYFRANDLAPEKMAASAAELKAGERVRITYAGSGDQPTMQRVQIVPAKTDKSTSKKS